MEVELDANHAALLDGHPHLASLIQHIRDKVSESDIRAKNIIGGLDHARVTLNSRQLLLDAVERIADPITVAEARISSESDSHEGERQDPILSISQLISQLHHDLYRPLQSFLASPVTISAEIRRIQTRLHDQRHQLARLRADVQQRLAVVYDAVRQALSLLQTLLIDHKLHRQRQFDQTLVEVLGQRVVAFDLKLRALCRRLQADTYTPRAVRALNQIRLRLRGDLEQARAEFDAIQRRLGQYAGIAEFDALVAEYGSVQRQICLQRELLDQLGEAAS